MNIKLVDYNKVKLAKFTAYKKYSRNVTYEGEFIDVRIDPKTVPKGKFLYHTRHKDDIHWSKPVTIEPKVSFNFSGSLITNKEIEFPNKDDKYIEITRVKINYS